MEIQRGERFLKVYEFMISDLGLSGVQLLLFARIFGFSAPEADGCFYESRARTAECLGVTERAVSKCMRGLLDKGLVLECGRHRLANGRCTRCYMANWEALEELGIIGRVTLLEQSSPVAKAPPERSSPRKGATPERSSPPRGNGVRPSIIEKKKENREERRSRYAEYDE